MDLKKNSKKLSKGVPIYMLVSTDKSTKEICPKCGKFVFEKVNRSYEYLKGKVQK